MFFLDESFFCIGEPIATKLTTSDDLCPDTLILWAASIQVIGSTNDTKSCSPENGCNSAYIGNLFDICGLLVI